MSPEQAEANLLKTDTRTDVYSLGVLLYELLTGTTPIERQRTMTEPYDRILQAIREEDPPRPSRRVADLRDQSDAIVTSRSTTADELTRTLHAELDWICLKALEKNPDSRYNSPGALGDELLRYLQNDVVEATPPSAAYRIRKFIRRYRYFVATATAFAVLLTIFSISAGVLAVWARDEAKRAGIAEGAAVEAQQKTAELLTEVEVRKNDAEELVLELRQNRKELTRALRLSFEILQARYAGRSDVETLLSVLKKADDQNQQMEASPADKARINVFRALYPLMRLQKLMPENLNVQSVHLRDDLVSADALLQEAISADPDLGLAYLIRSQLWSEAYPFSTQMKVLYAIGAVPVPDVVDVKSDWDNAVRLMPESSLARSGRGWWQFRTDELELAEVDLVAALELNPENDLALQGLAKLAAERADYQVAADFYLRALRVPQRAADVLFGDRRDFLRNEYSVLTFNKLWNKDAARIDQIQPAAVVRCFGRDVADLKIAMATVWKYCVLCLQPSESETRDRLLSILQAIDFMDADKPYRQTRDLLEAVVRVLLKADDSIAIELVRRSFPDDQQVWLGELTPDQQSALRDFLTLPEAGSGIALESVLRQLDRIMNSSPVAR